MRQVVFYITGLMAIALSAHASEYPQLKKPDAPSPERNARSRYFELRGAPSVYKANDGLPTLPPAIVHMEPQPEMPFSKSDAVLLGKVLKAEPYITNDGTNIYTEYEVQPLEVLKGTVSTAVVMVAQRGGKGTLPDGRVVSREVRGVNKPLQSGDRYLLFLTSIPDSSAFTVLKAWLFRNGVAAPQHEDDVALSRRGESRVAGAVEATVLSEARKLASEARK